MTSRLAGRHLVERAYKCVISQIVLVAVWSCEQANHEKERTKKGHKIRALLIDRDKLITENDPCLPQSSSYTFFFAQQCN